MNSINVDNENILSSESPPVVLIKAIYHSPELINLTLQEVETGAFPFLENCHGAVS